MTRDEARGRTVVITGASGGIGRACAAAFALRGDRLALIARGRAGLHGAVREAETAGAARVIGIEADVADPDAVEAAAQRIEDELGPIDVWVNDAFTSVFAPFTEITPKEFQRVTEVSYLGYVYATAAALRRMLPRDAGVVVQVGSALAYRGLPLQSACSGAKHALQGWHEALRCELLASGTRVRTTMVQMPAVNTPQFDLVRSRPAPRAQPIAPIYQPELAARAVLYAADHPGRREYWVGGSTAATLVANAIAPGLLDRYLARTGSSAQQTDEPQVPGARDDLFAPADAEKDLGAHGRFDDRAHALSFQLATAHHAGDLARSARRMLGRVLAGVPVLAAGIAAATRASGEQARPQESRASSERRSSSSDPVPSNNS